MLSSSYFVWSSSVRLSSSENPLASMSENQTLSVPPLSVRVKTIIPVLDIVKHQVHAHNEDHRQVKIVTIEHHIMELLREPAILQTLRVPLAHILTGHDEKTRGAAGAIYDYVIRPLSHELANHLAD